MIPAAGAGAVTVIVPVATAQVGCVGVTVGAAGVAGCGSIVTELDGRDTTRCILHSDAVRTWSQW